MKDLIDISNSEEVSKALQTAKILALGSPREIRKIMIERRDACHERGYHRVSKEKTEGTMICYDCELWFDKVTADASGWKYRVELSF